MNRARARAMLEGKIRESVMEIIETGANPHIDDIAAALLACCRQCCIGAERSQLVRLWYLAYFRALMEMIRVNYSLFTKKADNADRALAWTEAFVNVSRPARIKQIVDRHFRQSAKMPLICDIEAQLRESDRPALTPGQTEAAGVFTPGFGRRLYFENRSKWRKASNDHEQAQPDAGQHRQSN